MVTLENRFLSYNGTSLSPVISAKLAKAGFYFTGDNGKIKCFCCGTIFQHTHLHSKNTYKAARTTSVSLQQPREVLSNEEQTQYPQIEDDDDPFHVHERNFRCPWLIRLSVSDDSYSESRQLQDEQTITRIEGMLDIPYLY